MPSTSAEPPSNIAFISALRPSFETDTSNVTSPVRRLSPPSEQESPRQTSRPSCSTSPDVSSRPPALQSRLPAATLKGFTRQASSGFEENSPVFKTSSSSSPSMPYSGRFAIEPYSLSSASLAVMPRPNSARPVQHRRKSFPRSLIARSRYAKPLPVCSALSRKPISTLVSASSRANSSNCLSKTRPCSHTPPDATAASTTAAPHATHAFFTAILLLLSLFFYSPRPSCFSAVLTFTASTLSMRRRSMSMISSRQPSHSATSPSFGRRPSRSIIMPASVL